MLLALGCLPGTNVLAASLAAVAAQSHSAARVALPAEAPSVPTHGYVVVNQLMACAWTRYAQHDGSDGDGGGNGPPGDERPPPGPEGLLTFDWDEFERELAAWSDRTKVGV